MLRLAGEYQKAWELLFRGGKPLTTSQIAERVGVETTRMTQVICNMRRRRLVTEYSPAPGTRAMRYMVDGTCLAPQGATIGELQSPD